MMYTVSHWRGTGITVICFSFLTTFFHRPALGQTQEDDPSANLRTVSRPSPTAAALGRYAEWPVNLNTGTAGVDLPLYTLTGRSVEVPISLSYHSSGIKVSDVASWVGLGWSLNAGGVITRTVKGLPDECYIAGYFYVRETFPDKNYTFENQSPPTTNWIGKIKDAVTNDSDGLHDSYSLNAMGRSYRLLFKRVSTGVEIQTIPYSNVKVETDFHSWGLGSGKWKVTLEDGTVLDFGTDSGDNYVENTENYRVPSGCGYAFPSSWYLKQITSPTGDIVTFSYHPPRESGPVVTSFSYSDRSSWTALGNDIDVSLPSGKMDRQNFTVLNLKRIASCTGYVDFILSDTIRKDFPNQLALKELQAYRTVNGDTALVDRFSFYKHQASTQSSMSYQIPGNPDYVKWRMVLDSVCHNGRSTSTRIPRWKFEYNPLKLPSTVSFAQDHYGYYNGAVLNPHLLPGLTYSPNGTFVTFSGAANRNIDTTYAQAGMLTAITYPTQGRSEFKYESNRILTNTPQLEAHDTSLHLNLQQGQSPWTNETTITLSITKIQTVLLEVASDRSIVGDQSGLYVRGRVTGPGLDVTVNDNSSMYFNISIPGTYTFRLFTNLNEGNFTTGSYNYSTATLHYKSPTGPSPTTTFLGGLRIASIIDQPDKDTTHHIKRTFTYSDPRVMTMVDEQWDYFLDTEVNYGTHVTLIRTRNSHSSHVGFAAIVGYGKVITRYGNNDENGRLESRFINAFDINDSGVLFGQPPYPDMDTKEYERGLLWSELVFNHDGEKLTGKFYTYDFVETAKLTGYKAYRNSYPFQCPSDFCGYFVVRPTISNHFVKKTSAIESTYFRNGLGYDSTYQLTRFFYDTPGNSKPTRTQILNSRGDSLVTVERTVLEKSQIEPALTGDDDTAANSMLTLNMVGVVLQKKQTIKKGSTVSHLSTVTNQFKRQSTNPLIVTPARIETRIGQQTNQDIRVNFIRYDNKYNLTEQAKADDISHSYVYDYSSSLPIADVTNATALSIAFTSFESDGKGNWSFGAGISTSEHYNGSRSFQVSASNTPSISGLPANVYKVSWWAKNGSSITVNNSVSGIVQLISRRGWTLYEKEITNPTTITITGSGFIDDLRLHPKAAQMNTSTFIPMVGKTSETDASGKSTYYEYDDWNRLIAIRDDEGNLLKFINYHFKSKTY